MILVVRSNTAASLIARTGAQSTRATGSEAIRLITETRVLEVTVPGTGL